MASHFNPLDRSARYRQKNEEVYSYWIENWSEKRHEEIINNLNKFIDSGDYMLVSN